MLFWEELLDAPDGFGDADPVVVPLPEVGVDDCPLAEEEEVCEEFDDLSPEPDGDEPVVFPLEEDGTTIIGGLFDEMAEAPS